jgi:hypothetical protein
MIILGAGMAGCIAGIVNRNVRILEAAPGPQTNHHALIRFRSDAISKVTGIPFKQVHVQKSIWSFGDDVQPTVRICNKYAMKVTGHYIDRSINDISPVVRYVAPPDFHEQMLNILHNRIFYDQEVSGVENLVVRVQNGIYSRELDEPVISTLPIFTNAKLVDSLAPDYNFESNTIYITKFKIERCNKYATVYYPDPDDPQYRASLAGDELIIESIDLLELDHIHDVLRSFGLEGCINFEKFANEIQENGKIIPMPENKRKVFLYNLTKNHNLYSLGRFATWRNILLDDVLNDVYVINKMINTDQYDRMKGA